MRIRLASMVVVVAVVFSLGGHSVFAHPVSDPKTPVGETGTSSKSSGSTRNDARTDEKLRGDMLKLVAEVKAGKVAPRVPQFPRSQRNNLSTGAKIGIAAAIG